MAAMMMESLVGKVWSILGKAAMMMFVFVLLVVSGSNMKPVMRLSSTKLYVIALSVMTSIAVMKRARREAP